MIVRDLIELRAIAIQRQIEKDGLLLGQRRRAEILESLSEGQSMESIYEDVHKRLVRVNRFVLRVRFLLGLE